MHKLIHLLFIVWLIPCIRGGLLDFFNINITDPMNDLDHLEDRLLDGVQASIKEQRFDTIGDVLNGRVLRVVTVEDPPLSFTTMEGDKLVGRGVAFKIFQFLMDKYNFTYDIVEHGKNIIGSREELEGSLLESLHKNESDIAVAFLPILADTRDYIKYSLTTLDEGEWVMLMRRPVISATGTGLLAPFTPQVWLLILVSLLFVGPMIYIIIIIRFRMTGDRDQPQYKLTHCMWFVYGALMRQGSTLSPLADSTRLLFATWWIFITILTSFYTANLTAFLTLSKFTLPINSMEDILKYRKEFVSPKGGCVEYAILNTNESLNVMRKMYDDHKIVFTEKPDKNTLNDYVFEQGYVLVRDRPAITHLIYNDYQERKQRNPTDESKQCPFAMAKDAFMKRKRAFGYRHGFEFDAIFDPQLLTLVETGIVKFMLNENLTSAGICPQNLGGTERQLRNSDLSMTYWIMVAGFCTSVVIFFTEILFKCLNSRFLNGPKRTAMTSNKRTKKRRKLAPNVSPPPAYATLFNRSRVWTTADYKINSGLTPTRNTINARNTTNTMHTMNSYNNKDPLNTYNTYSTYNRMDSVTTIDLNGGRKETINGRSYMVYRNNETGEPKLVPLRAPSAALFQYTYTK